MRMEKSKIMEIIDTFRNTEKLYHFTSFDTALKIIESNRLRFGRLNNMNDIHENDKIVFTDANNQPINEFKTDLLDVLYDEIYKYRQISFTADDEESGKNGFDLHQMWGLYANKGEGICLVFDKQELQKSFEKSNYHHNRVNYDDTKDLESYVISNAQSYEEVLEEVKNRISDIFFHKRKEWEHEQEYRLIKKCPNPTKEEYLFLGHALKFVILSSRLLNNDKIRYSMNIKTIKEKVKKVEELRKKGNKGKIPVLIYGNGLFDYSLVSEEDSVELWNSKEGYDVLILGENCEYAE